MSENQHSSIAFKFGLTVMAVGAVFNILMILSGGWPTSFWLILMGLGLVILLIGVYARRNWIWKERPLGPVKRNAAWVGLLVFASFWMILFTCVDVPHTWTYEMTFDPPQDGAKCILAFADYPDYYIEIQSPNLARYLSSLPQKKLTAAFLVNTNFGVVHANRGAVIGEKTYFYYYGSKRGWSKSGKAPW